MANKILLTYVMLSLAFLLTGVTMLVYSLLEESAISDTPTVQTVARNLLLKRCPLTGAIANSVLIFITFLISIPAMVLPMSRVWLKLHGVHVVASSIFTLILGLEIWFDTLKTRSNLSQVWNGLPSATQSLLQQDFNCCGFFNSTGPPAFVIDSTCPNALIAAAKVGCVTPYSSYANNFLDIIFTAAFGFVGVNVALLLSIATVLKDRKEQARFRHIDEKSGAGRF